MVGVKTETASLAGGAGFYTLLFACLKLARVTDWSWWWVFAPLLGCAAVVAWCIGMIIGTLAWPVIRRRR